MGKLKGALPVLIPITDNQKEVTTWRYTFD